MQFRSWFPESADWYNSSYIIAWGSNVPQTRTPDAHFFTEVRYKGTKTVAVTPDYAEIAKLCYLWLAPKQGTDAAMALAICTLLDKPSRREVNVPVEFIGFSIPDEFVVGYGIDYAQRYRHLPYIGKVILLDE